MPNVQRSATRTEKAPTGLQAVFLAALNSQDFDAAISALGPLLQERGARFKGSPGKPTDSQEAISKAVESKAITAQQADRLRTLEPAAVAPKQAATEEESEAGRQYNAGVDDSVRANLEVGPAPAPKTVTATRGLS